MEKKEVLKRKVITTKTITVCAMSVALMAVCSWITVPIIPQVPFTLQTFAVFATLGLLGGELGTLAILVYIILGAFGLPVFAGFKSGMGVLMGPTGGYIIGFLFSGIIYLVITKIFTEKTVFSVLSMVLGLVALYAFGTVWFLNLKTAIDLKTALTLCVIPFIIPDVIKLVLAVVITRRVRKYVRG